MWKFLFLARYFSHHSLAPTVFGETEQFLLSREYSQNFEFWDQLSKSSILCLFVNRSRHIVSQRWAMLSDNNSQNNIHLREILSRATRNSFILQWTPSVSFVDNLFRSKIWVLSISSTKRVPTLSFSLTILKFFEIVTNISDAIDLQNNIFILERRFTNNIKLNIKVIIDI